MELFITISGIQLENRFASYELYFKFFISMTEAVTYIMFIVPVLKKTNPRLNSQTEIPILMVYMPVKTYI